MPPEQDCDDPDVVKSEVKRLVLVSVFSNVLNQFAHITHLFLPNHALDSTRKY